MGKIREWLKKNKSDLYAYLSIAATLGGGFGLYYYFTKPEGVQLWAEADGKLTAEERIQFDNIHGKVVNEYNPVIRSFVNDFDVFIAKEFEAKGLPSNRFDEDMHIVIVEHNRIGSVCPEDAGGCLKKMKDTIYMENYGPEGIMACIWHEAGHSFRNSSDSPYLRELFSESNEIYSKMKMYCFDRELGIEHINETLKPNIWGCEPDEKELPYVLGEIGFFVQANKAKGDLERALYNILNDRQTNGTWEGIKAFFTGDEGCLECDTQNAVRQYPDLCSAYYGEYRKLIEQPYFIEGFQRHMSMADAQELMEYLRLMLDYGEANNRIFYTNNYLSWEEISNELKERALSSHITNPMLKQEINSYMIRDSDF